MVAATSQAPVPGQFTPAALMQHLAVVAVVPGHPEFVCNNMKYKKNNVSSALRRELFYHTPLRTPRV
jgi:hypothetical protein